MATPKTARAGKRRLAGNIRRELIAAELERLREENAELKAKADKLTEGRAEYNSALLSFDPLYAGWDYLLAARDVIARASIMQSLLHEFLSTHCAPLDLRERATAAVGKPPLTFSTKEQDCE